MNCPQCSRPLWTIDGKMPDGRDIIRYHPLACPCGWSKPTWIKGLRAACADDPEAVKTLAEMERR